MTQKKTLEKVSAGTIKLIETAKDLGVPRESLKLFLEAGYVPQPKQLQFHAAACAADNLDNPNEIGFGGARGPGKTHATFAQVALRDCQIFPGIKVLFLRKVSKAATEAIEDLRQSVLFKTPHTFKVQKATIVFPNKSRIIVGHFAHEKDIDNYLGLEYDIIVIEEATQLSASKIEKIKTCNRSAKENFRPRIYYTTNPGGVGHQWFKKKFILPFRELRENLTKFIPATSRDNKKLNKEYVKTVLEPLTGWLREAWLEGNWDVFAGQFFSNFNYDLHVFAPKQIPDKNFIKQANLDVWCSLDYGYKHYTVCYLFTKYDGDLIVLDEFSARRQLIKTICDGIKEMLSRWELTPSDLLTFVAGTDVFAKKGDSGESYADAFAENGIYLHPANTNRIQGAGRILEKLGDKEQHIEPSIKISSNCKGLIETLPILEHNPNNPMDVLKVDVDDDGNGGDDYYDGGRYGVMAESVNISIG